MPDDILHQLAADASERYGSVVCGLAPVTLLEDGLDQRVLPYLRDLTGVERFLEESGEGRGNLAGDFFEEMRRDLVRARCLSGVEFGQQREHSVFADGEIRHDGVRAWFKCGYVGFVLSGTKLVVEDVCLGFVTAVCETVAFQRGYTCCVVSPVFDQAPEVRRASSTILFVYCWCACLLARLVFFSIPR